MLRIRPTVRFCCPRDYSNWSIEFFDVDVWFSVGRTIARTLIRRRRARFKRWRNGNTVKGECLSCCYSACRANTSCPRQSSVVHIYFQSPDHRVPRHRLQRHATIVSNLPALHIPKQTDIPSGFPTSSGEWRTEIFHGTTANVFAGVNVKIKRFTKHTLSILFYRKIGNQFFSIQTLRLQTEGTVNIERRSCSKKKNFIL